MQDGSWLDQKCADSFGSEWRRVRDDPAEALAKELLAKANLERVVIICSGGTDKLDLAGADVHDFGFEHYLFIQLNEDFRLAIGGELRGVIAHEVGHLLVSESCNALLRAGNNARFINCEHEVDMAGESLAGAGVVIQMLKWTEAYTSRFARPYGYGSDLLWNLRRRIILGEQRNSLHLH